MGIFDIFKGGNKDEKELVVLANDIYTKYQATCDVLSKIKKKNKEDIVKSLETNGVQLDKGNMNLREIHLDIGNAWVFSMIRNEDNSMTDFKKYEFHIMGIRDYQGLNLYFDNGKKERRIEVVDLAAAWGKMSNALNQKRVDEMKVGKHTYKLYELIHSKGRFRR